MGLTIVNAERFNPSGLY